MAEAAGCRELLGRLGVRLVWYDSLGAKSACVAVRGVLIDPGAAAMQPSYPLPEAEKRRLRREAVRRVLEASSAAEAVVVTHYHYDHHLRPGDPDAGPATPYDRARLLVLKSPAAYINESQWGRARELVEALLRRRGLDPRDYLEEPGGEEYPDPVDGLRTALSRSFGDYEPRRRELLRRGREWFRRLSSEWARRPRFRERVDLPGGARLVLSDTYAFEASGVRVRLLGPHFHGVEYDRTGWVVPVLIEVGGSRVLYTSDLMGPIIEDYAEEVVRLRPRILLADGPPTYLYPYMLNRVNLMRAVENMVYILESCRGLELVIYDHHLLRERRWRERVAPVLEASRRTGVPVLTAAECLGSRPLVDQL